MAHLLINWLLSALLLFLVAHIVPGFYISGYGTALLTVILIGLINSTFGLFLRVISFPITILTLGLFLLVINAVVLKITAWLMPGFAIKGFIPALIAAVLLSILHLVLRYLVFPHPAVSLPEYSF